eukprot:gene6827-1220_t
MALSACAAVTEGFRSVQLVDCADAGTGGWAVGPNGTLTLNGTACLGLYPGQLSDHGALYLGHCRPEQAEWQQWSFDTARWQFNATVLAQHRDFGLATMTNPKPGFPVYLWNLSSAVAVCETCPTPSSSPPYCAGPPPLLAPLHASRISHLPSAPARGGQCRFVLSQGRLQSSGNVCAVAGGTSPPLPPPPPPPQPPNAIRQLIMSDPTCSRYSTHATWAYGRCAGPRPECRQSYDSETVIAHAPEPGNASQATLGSDCTGFLANLSVPIGTCFNCTGYDVAPF